MLNSRNAFTSHYRTAYASKCLPEHLSTVLEKMSEYVFQPFIRTEDVEHERRVITQEAWRVYKNNKFLNYAKEYHGILYHGHERARIGAPIGWPDSIARISQDDIRDFHKTHYVKDNLTIFLVGAVNPGDLDILEKILEKIPAGAKCDIELGKIGKPLSPRLEKSSDEIGTPREQVAFSLTRLLPNTGEFSEEAMNQTHSLLQDILFERLRIEHSLCYAVKVGWKKYKDFSDFDVTIETSQDKLNLVEEEVWKVAGEILEGIWQDRFAILHKNAIDLIKSKERMSDFIIEVSASELERSGKIITLEEMLNNAGKVTYEDVKKLTRKLFDKDNVFTEVITPST